MKVHAVSINSVLAHNIIELRCHELMWVKIVSFLPNTTGKKFNMHMIFILTEIISYLTYNRIRTYPIPYNNWSRVRSV